MVEKFEFNKGSMRLLLVPAFKTKMQRFCWDFLPHQDYPSLPGSTVAPAGSQDQGFSPRPEGAEGSLALPHAV